jgi:hypothetical protein
MRKERAPSSLEQIGNQVFAADSASLETTAFLSKHRIFFILWLQ